MKLSKAYLKSFGKELVNDTWKTTLVMFRIMIPVTIIVKILQETGVIYYIGLWMAPLMKFVGLPGEMALAWATGMITNLYGGILAYIQLSSSANLSIAQVTVLMTMMLVAHTFPIELQVARKTGVKVSTMFFIRFFSALVIGFIIFHFFKIFNFYNEPAQIAWIPDKPIDTGLWAWALREVKNYIIIFIIIFLLIFLIKILRDIGLIKVINRIMHPVLKFMGIGDSVCTITIIGLMLGIVYGAALIINESNNPEIRRKDIFYSMVFMGLCHSIIEDTLLVMALGACFMGVFIIRIIFSTFVTWGIVKITEKLSKKNLYKYLLIRK